MASLLKAISAGPPPPTLGQEGDLFSDGFENKLYGPKTKAGWSLQVGSGLLPIETKSLSAPPASPIARKNYIVGPSPTGLWADHANDIATHDGISWVFSTPTSVNSVFVIDLTAIYSWNLSTSTWVLVNDSVSVAATAASAALAAQWASAAVDVDVVGAPPGSRSALDRAAAAASSATAAAASAAQAAGIVYVKIPVRAATTRHITLSGLQTIDGVSIGSGERVLVRMQDSHPTNGVYVAAAGAWARAADMDVAAEVTGAVVFVQGGAQFGGKLFRCVTEGIVLGTTELVFTEETTGGSVHENCRRSRGTIVYCGDSNYGGRIAWKPSTLNEWKSVGGPFETWTSYNMGVSGFTIGTGFLDKIANGNKAEAPADYTPGGATWGGNVWQIVNANPDLIIFSLGINDMNGVASRASYGSPANFKINLRKAIEFLLSTCPRAAILLHMPAPFAGENFISGTFNTEWEVDSSDLTIDTGAAENSARIRSTYLEWIGKHPRVSVWDSAELFGVRVDDKAVNGQDPEGGGPLLEDSLHFSNHAGRRIVQYLTRFMFGPQASRMITAVQKSTDILRTTPFWARPFFYSGISNSGANGLITLRPSPESVFQQHKLTYAGGYNSIVPMSRLHDSELAFLIGNMAQFKELFNLRVSATNPVKLYFPASGNTYAATLISLSNTVVDSDGETYYQLRFDGINPGGIEAASGTFWAYVESTASLPFIQKDLTVPITSTTRGSARNKYNVTWTPLIYLLSRPDGTGAVTCVLYAQNQGDGRMVDGAFNDAAPGREVGTFVINNGQYKDASFTLNATNWPSNFIFKSNYWLVAIATAGTFANGATISLRE